MPDAPRLLLVSFAAFPAANGASTRLAQRIAAFADAGYLVDVLTPKTSDLPHVSKLGGARILRVPMPPPVQPPFALRAVEPPLSERCSAFERAVRRQLKGGDYDAVHVLDPWSGHSALDLRDASGDAGARVVFEAGGGLPPTDDDAELALEMRRRERELLREADLVFVPTEVARNRATGLGAPPAKVHVLRPSADLGLFVPSRDRSRRPASPARVALAAASLSRAEIDLVAAALERLPRVYDIVVHASAAVPSSVQERIARSPMLADRFVFERPVLYEDLGPFYERADLGLAVCAGPVRGEYPPPRLQVIAEMMAAGLAQVLPDVPAVREVATDRSHALLVRPADPEGLSAALEALVAHPSRRQRLGRAARDQATEVLDEMVGRSFLLECYARLLARRLAQAAPPSYDEIPTNISQESARPGNGSLRRAKRARGSASRPNTGRLSLASARLKADSTTDPDMEIHKRAALTELAPVPVPEPEEPITDRSRRR